MKTPDSPLAAFSSKNVQNFLILLSWVIYAGALLIFRTSLQNSELLGLVTIPVMITGWLTGTRNGFATALFGTALHMVLKTILEFGRLEWQTFLFQHLIGVTILTLTSIFVGYLRDSKEKQLDKIDTLDAAEKKLSRYGNLLNLINQYTTHLLSSTQWEDRMADFVIRLGQAAQVEHVYLCEIHSSSPDSFLLYLRHNWHADGNQTSRKPKLGKFTPADSGIGFWAAQAREGDSFAGQISTLPQRDRAFLLSIERGDYLILPIFTKYKLWGLVGFEASLPSLVWEEFELDAIGTLVQTLGYTIHNREIEETLNERAKELETLHETSQQISSTDQLETTLESILEQILALSPAQEAEVYLYSNHKLTLGASLLPPSQRPTLPSPSVGSELAYSAARKNKTIFISNTKEHPLFQDLQEYQAGSVIAFPLRIAREVIGVMNVWYPIARSLPEEETRILRLFGDQAATAIQNTQYFQAEHEERKLAEALRQANLKLTSNLDLASVLESILEQTLNLISAQDAHIFLYDGKRLSLGAVKWRDSTDQKPMALPREDGLTYKVARSGKSILVSDMRRHSLFTNAPPEWKGSIIGLPLKFREKVIGVMNIAFAEPRSFTEKDLRTLNLLSDQAVLAINNARIFETERKQRKMAEALQTTGQIVKSSLELNTVLDHILTQLENVVPYDTANLALIQHGKAHVVRTQGYEKFKPELLSEVKALSLDMKNFPILEKMIQSQQPAIISDTESDPKWIKTKTSFYINSWAGAPLLGQEGVLGFLFLNKAEKGFYKPEHRKWISVFASQAAIAIENARLFESSQQNARKLKSLHQATSTLVTTLELNELLENILAAAITAIPVAEKGSLMLQNPSTQQLKVHACKGYADKRVEDFSLSIQNGYASLAFREKAPRLFNDIQINTSLHYENEIAEISSIQSAISAPLISQADHPLGVLSLDSEKPNAFTHADLELLASFAATATSAIVNAQLHAEVQELAITDSLTQTLNRRGLLQWGEYELERSKRFKRPLAAIFFDLDHFKDVNDSYGHDVGDQMLSQVAERSHQVIRQVDILGRYGGEEFVIILPETGLSKAFTIAERLRKAISISPFIIDAQKIKMTISLGVAEINPETQSLTDLIKAADQAMYHSKQNGRNKTSRHH